MKKQLIRFTAAGLFALALAAPATAEQPYGVKDCGFSVLGGLSKSTAGYIGGQTVDCLAWGCIPIVGPLAWLVGWLSEIDTDCAGVVVEIKHRDGRYQYWWHWDGNSLSGVRDRALRKCKDQYPKSSCAVHMVFRHAMAGYRPKGSRTGKAYFAQGADIPTARQIAKARCREAAGKTPCVFLGSAENSN